MANTLTFITSHPDKAEQLAWHLDYPIVHQNLDIPEIQSLDPIEVVTAKTHEAYRQLGRAILVEDTSIRFVALGRLPGPLIKFFLEELKPEGLCRLLDAYDSRAAVVETYFGYCNGENVEIFDASIEGQIATEPRGTNAFGTDSIFIPTGHTKTWGEMTKDEWMPTSTRRTALNKLQAYLKNHHQ